MPTPVNILLKKVGQWPSHFSVICVVQIELNRLGHCASNWQGQVTYAGPFKIELQANDFGLDLSGVSSQATLPNDAPQKGNLFSTKDALGRISIELICAHALCIAFK